MEHFWNAGDRDEVRGLDIPWDGQATTGRQPVGGWRGKRSS